MSLVGFEDIVALSALAITIAVVALTAAAYVIAAIIMVWKPKRLMSLVEKHSNIAFFDMIILIYNKPKPYWTIAFILLLFAIVLPLIMTSLPT